MSLRTCDVSVLHKAQRDPRISSLRHLASKPTSQPLRPVGIAITDMDEATPGFASSRAVRPASRCDCPDNQIRSWGCPGISAIRQRPASSKCAAASKCPGCCALLRKSRIATARLQRLSGATTSVILPRSWQCVATVLRAGEIDLTGRLVWSHRRSRRAERSRVSRSHG